MRSEKLRVAVAAVAEALEKRLFPGGMVAMTTELLLASSVEGLDESLFAESEYDGHTILYGDVPPWEPGGATPALPGWLNEDPPVLDPLEDPLSETGDPIGDALGTGETSTLSCGCGSVAVSVYNACNAYEAYPQSNGYFRFTANYCGCGTGPTSVTVNYSLSGTATSFFDYCGAITHSSSVTIPLSNGSGTAWVPYVVNDDTTYEPDETVVTTLTGGIADDGSAINIVDNPATSTIFDDDLTVSIAATQSPVTEGDGQSLQFTVSHTQADARAVTVYYSRGGTAAAPGDYTAPPGSVTIPAGAQSAVISVPVIDDTVQEADETLTLTLSAGSQYKVNASAASATGTIQDNDAPVSISVYSSCGAYESSPQTDGYFRFSATATGTGGSIPTSVTANYNLTGTATKWSDYSGPLADNASVIIPLSNGSGTVWVPFQAIDDSIYEPDETVVTTLTGGTANNGAPITLGDNPATSYVYDDDLMVSIAATQSPVTEGDGQSLQYTVSHTQANARAVTVQYSRGGTATAPGDYTAPPDSITILANAQSAVIDVPVIDDPIAEDTETVVLTLAAYSMRGYTVNPDASTATGEIKDDPEVEFLDKDDNVTNTLKVAKWQDAFNTDGTVKANFVDLDPDRFKVQVTDFAKKGAGTVTVKLSTDSEGAEYDDATVITLTETGANTGVFRSKTQMLMSDDVDDDHEIDGVADDANEDRSHEIALAGDAKAEYTSAAGVTRDATANVPVVKTVKLNVNILREAAGGNAVIANADVEARITVAHERYAQAGIRFTHTINAPVDPPAGVDLANGLDEFAAVVDNVIQMTDEEKALLGAAALRSAAADVEAYYVNSLSAGSRGEAFPTGFVPDQKYAHSVIIAATAETVFSLAHEIGHVVEDKVDHYAGANKNQNLMRSGTSATNTVDASKRLTEDQATNMLASVLAT